ncbi:hypothetical protein CDAR_86251 [Caerostris darwini]|uniref:Uncharacterized protein n=1 Tax=Caerostris darwini TaxID=1538125 RepID=A0AAV4NR71_9ARAC|nr:hypothetical protein CDAR_86251 [Caerostris darwini]
MSLVQEVASQAVHACFITRWTSFAQKGCKESIRTVAFTEKFAFFQLSNPSENIPKSHHPCHASIPFIFCYKNQKKNILRKKEKVREGPTWQKTVKRRVHLHGHRRSGGGGGGWKYDFPAVQRRHAS